MKKESTSKRLKELMKLRDLKQIDIVNLAKPYCKQYDIKLGRNDISQYIAGKVEPTQNKLLILSEALNVNVAWLMGLDVDIKKTDSISHCDICDFSFCSNDAKDVAIHSIRHDKCLDFITKNGFWWNYSTRENVKSESAQILKKTKSTREEKINAAENICKAYFCRSVGAVEFDPRHPNFEKYTAMLLNQKHFKELYNGIYDELVNKYGTIDGMRDGETYINNEQMLENNIQDKNIEIYSLYNQLNTTDKAEIKGIIKGMLSKYPKNNMSK